VALEAGVAEHAALAEEVAEVAPRQPRRQHAVQAAAHGEDALAHGGHVGLPRGAQRRLGEHAATMPAAWIAGLE
jgi:hypothetical protein